MSIIEEELIEFHGKTGNKYRFEAYCLDMEFRTNSKAVYILTKRTPRTENSDYYNRLYVGETDNMATVIQDYVNSPCLQEHGVDSICVRFDNDKKNRRRVVNERYYWWGRRSSTM